MTQIADKIQVTLTKVEVISTEMLAVPPVDQASKTELNQAKKSLLMYVTKCNQLEEILDQDLGQIDPADLNKQVVSKLSLEIQHLKTELSNVQA